MFLSAGLHPLQATSPPRSSNTTSNDYYKMNYSVSNNSSRFATSIREQQNRHQPQFEDADILSSPPRKSAALDKMQARIADAKLHYNSTSNGGYQDPPPKKVAPWKLAKKNAAAAAAANCSIISPRTTSKFVVSNKIMNGDLLKKESKKKQDSSSSSTKKSVMKSFKKGKGMKVKSKKKKSVVTEEDDTVPRGWEFGKKKHFKRHVSSPVNDKAAIQIQRIMRGGMQRLHYFIAKYQWLFKTKDQRTSNEIDHITRYITTT